MHSAANQGKIVQLDAMLMSGLNLARAALLADQQENDHDSSFDNWGEFEQETLAALFSEGSLEIKVTDLSGLLQVNALVLTDEEKKLADARKDNASLRADTGVFDMIKKEIELNRENLAINEGRLNIYKKLLSVSRGSKFEPDEGAMKRRIKFAQEFEETNKLKILRLKEEIKLNQRLANAEHSGAKVREQVLKETLGDMTEIAMLEKEDRDTAIATAQEKEVMKWTSTLSAFTVGSAKYIKQKVEFDIGIQAAQDKADEKLLLSAEKLNNDLAEVDRFRLDEKVVNIEKNAQLEKIELEALRDTELKAQQDVIDGTAKGSAAEKRELEKLEFLRVKYFNLEIERQIALLRARMAQVDVTKAQKVALEELIKSLEGTMQTFKTLGEEIYTGKGAWVAWSEEAEKVLGGISDLGNAIFDRRISNIEKEIDAETEKYDRFLELAKDDEAETKIIERNKALRLKQLEAEKRKEQIKQAKFQKAISINQALINGAQGVTASLAYGGPVGIALAAITAALAAVEVATIIATPIPTFAEGGIMGKDGKAMINDGGNMEYVERNGQILTASTENALVNLKSGDVIHKDYDTLIRKSMLMNGMFGGTLAGGGDDLLLLGIENSIEKGFKKARNTVNVSVLNEHNGYREKMMNWN